MGPSVGVARPELGGLCDDCLKEEMSMVGEGRVERGVSMVDGRVMEGGFIRSSLVLVAKSAETLHILDIKMHLYMYINHRLLQNCVSKCVEDLKG